jgi:hypothetical protein
MTREHTFSIVNAGFGLVIRGQLLRGTVAKLAFVASKASSRLGVVTTLPPSLRRWRSRLHRCWSEVKQFVGIFPLIMSLSSTTTIKAQLTSNLGAKSNAYFDTLLQFISGKISRTEFDESVRQALDSPHLSASLAFTWVCTTLRVPQFNSTMH